MIAILDEKLQLNFSRKLYLDHGGKFHFSFKDHYMPYILLQELQNNSSLLLKMEESILVLPWV
jgi:hypothetical protein